MGKITPAELVFIVSATSVIAIGWVALVLAQLGSLTRTTLLLAFSPVLIIIIALAPRHFRFQPSGLAPATRNTQHATRNSQFTIHNSQFVIRNLLLVGILLVAAFLYTPPADYTPAVLDAGWYTSAGALIARTGSLTTRPPVLEALPAADRSLFVRTYHDLNASLPRFPDRRDLGFYNLAFAIDLGQDGPVVPYHPPFASAWIATLQLVGGPEFSTYAAPLFGLLFVLTVYATGCAIFGPNIGLVGAFLTALSPPVVYYARTPFAELLAGALIWAGVYALSRYVATCSASPKSRAAQTSVLLFRDNKVSKRRVPRHPNPSAAPLPPCPPVPSGSSGPSSPSTFLLLLAGLAFGAAFLTKFESLLLLPSIAAFWLIWLRHRWATRRELAAFLAPFGILAGYSIWLYATVLRPYTALNGYGIWSMLVATFSRPTVWGTLTVLYVGGISILLVIRYTHTRYWRLGTWRQSPVSNTQSLISNLQQTASLTILIGGGSALLLAWPAAQANSSVAWSAVVTLGLFLTPLGLCLGVVGFAALVADDLSRQTTPLVMLLSTAGLTTALMPAISSNVSYLYTIRRQLPIVLPALLLLTGYVTLRWAGLATGDQLPRRQPAGWRRMVVILILATLVIHFLDFDRPLIQYQELAGSSSFVAKLAQSFKPEDIVLFEGVDRGAHVGRFAAPLWAEHGVWAMLLSSTYPPQAQLARVIKGWQEQGRRGVYFISQSQPPPFSLPGFRWQLIDKQHWAGITLAAKMSFPPETWVVEVPFYIYEPVSLSSVTVAQSAQESFIYSKFCNFYALD